MHAHHMEAVPKCPVEGIAVVPRLRDRSGCQRPCAHPEGSGDNDFEPLTGATIDRQVHPSCCFGARAGYNQQPRVRKRFFERA